jgi:NADPH-dependent ferric siderophore reductase
MWIATDSAALPAVQTIVATLPVSLPVKILAVVPTGADWQVIDSPADLDFDWRYDHFLPVDLDSNDSINIDIASLRGPGQVWIAGESTWVDGWKQFWVGERRIGARRMKFEEYWKCGERDYRD